MRRFKIFLTFFVIYESVIIAILHSGDYCTVVFNSNFCAYETYKYFSMCLMLPILFTVFLWWMPNIKRFFCNNTCKTQHEHHKEARYDILHEMVSHIGIERFITAAIVTGINRFAKNHPKTVATFDDILKTMNKTKK